MQCKTEKGTVIKRSKYGVGKDIGGAIYFHKAYIEWLPCRDHIYKLNSETGMNFITNYQCIKWEPKTNIVTFFRCPDFDYEHEPTAGDWIRVKPEAIDSSPAESVKKGYIKFGHTSQIWHHKWMWVTDQYKGFDVEVSFKRSEEWLKIKNINFSKIGNKDYWYPLLKKHKIKF